MAFPGGLLAQAAGIRAPGTESNREDLIDVAINLDRQKKAAVFLAAPKTVCNGLNHDWLVDTLPATSTAGAVEGNDWSVTTASGTAMARIRLSNSVQTFVSGFAVSKDQVEYSLKGMTPAVANEYEHQVERFLLAIEQSVDARIVASGAAVSAVSASASGASAVFAAIRAWHASASAATGSVTTAGVTGNFIGASKINVSGSWSRTAFISLHQAMYALGADPDTLAVEPGIKQALVLDIMGETASATGQPANASAIYGVPPVVRQLYQQNLDEFQQDIQFMRTPFGRVAVLVDRFIPTSASATTNAVSGDAAFLYERARLRVAFWRPMRHYPLPPTGDAIKGYVHTGVTLEVLHPGTVGTLYNLQYP